MNFKRTWKFAVVYSCITAGPVVYYQDKYPRLIQGVIILGGLIVVVMEMWSYGSGDDQRR